MGFQGFLKQSTAVDVLIGPFVDSTDGDSEETLLTISQADVRLSKNGQTGAQKNDATACAHDADGFYNCELDATDTNTVGQLTLYVHETGALAVRHDYHVVEEAIYDALFGASAAGFNASGLVTLAAVTHTGATIPTVTTLTGHTAQTGDSFARLGAPAAASVSADIATVDGNVDAILVDTAEIGAAGAGLTALATQASVNTVDSNVDAVLVDTAALANDIIAETADATLLAQLQKLTAVIESNRGAHTHQPIGRVIFVDPVGGATHASGNRGGISDPYSLVQDAHDNAVTDSNHDLIILLSGGAAGVTTLTEDVTLSKRYLLVRGPGRDFVWTRSGAGDTIAVTADGIELSGFQLETAATGSGAGIQATDADFLRVHNVWINDTQGDGINILRGSNCQIRHNHFQASGQGGTGQGVHIVGTGGASNNNEISDNTFEDTAGDAINIESGTTNNTKILRNVVEGSTGWGIDITASSTDAFVADNRLGNNTSGAIQDAGTTSVLLNNEQWGTAAALATVDTVVDTILVDTADIQPKLGTPAADISADIAAVKVDTAAILVDTGTTLDNALAVVDANVDLILADTADIQPKIGTPAADLSADIAAIQADTDDIQTRIPAALVGGAMDSDVSAIQTAAAQTIRDEILPTQNAGFNNIMWLWVAASDHVTPVTGATTMSVTRSIDAGAFGAGTGTGPTEIGNGIYQYDASAADMNGGVITFRFVATGGTPGAPDDAFVTIVTGGGV